MPRTFYLAGPEGLRDEISLKARVLTDQFGLRWVGNWDWTRFGAEDLGSPGELNGKLAVAGGVAGDLAAAMNADLFLLAIYPEHRQLGGHMELGARIGAGRESHVVLNMQAAHMFYGHPMVITHTSWDDFFRWLKTELEAGPWWRGR